MGDWRTLHFFDKENYIEKVVPLVRNLDSYLPTFLNEKRMEWLSGFSYPAESLLNDAIKFVSELNKELIIHPELIKIDERKTDENYPSYLKRTRDEFESFIRFRKYSIEFFQHLLIETIFSNVADFNPHFILGKRMFETCIKTEKNSFSEKLASQIVTQQHGAILGLIDGGIINWLSNEEVELLYLDRDNISHSNEEDIPNEESIEYVNEFKEFLRIAVDSDLGLISLRNPSEYDLSKLQNNFNSIDNFEGSSTYKYIVVNYN